MTSNGQIAIPLDMAAIREPFLALQILAGGLCPVCGLFCRSLRPLSLRCDCEGLWNEGQITAIRRSRNEREPFE